MSAIKRRFVDVNGRRVHYRALGEGPPLVLLHGSPGNSEMMLHEMQAASRYFACFALDAPGFGSSDALPGAELQVADLAHATADAMAAIGLPPCTILGTHSGAAIGAEIGVHRPERVTGLVLDGFPVFTQAEIDALFQGYFEPMIVDPLGAHLFRTWMRFRDQFTWFPWTARKVERLNPVDRPTPEEIDHWVSMFYRSCKTYAPAYKAVCHYGQRAIGTAQALGLPAIFTASAEDMLFGHLDRLPPLKANQRIARLPYDPQAKYAALTEFACSLPRGATAQAAPRGMAGADPGLQFIDLCDGTEVFVRTYGEPRDTAIVLLHDAPGSGQSLDPVARSLASRNRFVVLADLPANGESGDPAGAALEAGADAVDAMADALGLTSFVLAATGCGCAVAAVFASRGDARLAGLWVHAPAAPDAVAAQAIAPPIELSADGSHWLRAWMMVRDGQIYHPWFDGRVRAQRKTQGNFDAQWLHDQTVEVMKARPTYHRLPRESLAFDTMAALKDASGPLRVADPGQTFGDFILASL